MEGTELLTIDTEQVSLVLSGAPEALTLNKTTVVKADAASQALIDTIEAQGMSDELDAEINKHLVKVRLSIEKMNERRKPITQIFDAIKKEFTSLESILDPKSPGSKYSILQKKRDDYAAQKVEERRRAEAEAQRKLDQDKELIRIKSECGGSPSFPST